MLDQIQYVVLRNEPEPIQAALCRQFYEDVYKQSFPDPVESEDPSIWLPLLRDVRPPHKPCVHMIVAKAADGNVKGGIIFEFYARSNSWLATYIAVMPNSRRLGLGRALLDRAVLEIARTAGSNRWVLFAEAENPEKITDPATRAIATERLYILDSLGMRQIPIGYVQPALRPGNAQADYLILMCYAPPELPRHSTVTSSKLSHFLNDLYRSLEQPEDPSLLWMRAQAVGEVNFESLGLRPSLPAIFDNVLGKAESIGLRFTFISSVDLSPNRDTEVNLDRIRRIIDGTDHDKKLVSPLSSFFRDIVARFEADRSLPIVVLSEPFGSTAAPISIRISVPSTIRLQLEGRRRRVKITDDGKPLIISARMVDCFSMFESGYVTYSPTFTFEHADQLVDFNASILLAFMAASEPAAIIDTSGILFSKNFDVFLPLNHFLARRLDSLAPAATDNLTIFSLLRLCYNEDSGPLCAIRTLTKALRRAGSATDTASVTVSVGAEILGASRHDDICRSAHAAKSRDLRVDPFVRTLAGFVQNVLDYSEQDISEVHDSLASFSQVGTAITFAHKDITVHFSRSDRANETMSTIIGGSPYLLLLQVVIAHNDKLLRDLHQELRSDYGDTGMSSMMQAMLTIPVNATSFKEMDDRLNRTLTRRIRLAQYIPNIFRYTTERQFYDLLSEARGASVQHKHFEQLEHTLEGMVNEIVTLKKERADHGIQNRLIALSVLQSAGVFAAIAAIADEDFRHLFETSLHLHFPHFVKWFSHNTVKDEAWDIDIPSAVWALVPAFILIGAFAVWLLVIDLLPRTIRRLELLRLLRSDFIRRKWRRLLEFLVRRRVE